MKNKKHSSVLVSVSTAVTYETRPAIYIYTSQNRAGDIFIALSRKINPYFTNGRDTERRRIKIGKENRREKEKIC